MPIAPTSFTNACAGSIHGRLWLALSEYAMTPDRHGVTLSILDRLTDLDPDSGREAGSGHGEDLRAAKASLCRDLAAILNTRRAEDEIDPKYEEVNSSLLTFGVTDFTS